ncbi:MULTISPECIES: hypothetical protein [Lactobacillus]|uniref:hypothetical protein n=1 Tax=Lactobacillus TaxID=1578 RepID=UPI0008A41AAC|nr:MULTISPECIES: hypothetical protein [Lactobacillus]MBM6987347.1 hypothetical protein [Lactobacillus delbrueckii]MBT8916954.1 hypothetical protein [Lactobacillus delbrueckii subsp. bulgaricus]MCD5503990.1 hypothetical protein [Lactobacillus delbrueckii subsp. lactis]OFS84172.1 hypothetical protein HMPREF3168_00205 [Lactobacillus sp. HMSC08B12]
MRSTEETMLMDTMIANGVSNKMTEQATGLAAPKPVQKENAAKLETRDMLLANGVDEEMADLAADL